MKNNAISQYYKKKSGNNYTNISTDNELLSLSNGNIIQYTDGSEYLKVGNNVFDKTNNGYATSSDVSTNYSLKSNTVKSISSADANGNCTVTMDNGNTNSFKAGVSSNELNAVNNASISKIDDANTSTGICSCKNASGTQIDTFTCHVSKTNKNANLTYGAKTTIATIDGTDITVTMPTALDTKSVVSNKNATLNWGTSTTIATVDNQNISVKLPNNPNTDTTYSAGTGLSLSGNSFNVNIPNYKVSDGSNPDETYIMTLDVNQGACHPSQYTIGNLVDKINNSGKTYSAGTGLFLSGTEFNVDIPNYKVSDGFNPDGAYIMTLDVNQGACHPSQYTIGSLVDKINSGSYLPMNIHKGNSHRVALEEHWAQNDSSEGGVDWDVSGWYLVERSRDSDAINNRIRINDVFDNKRCKIEWMDEGQYVNSTDGADSTIVSTTGWYIVSYDENGYVNGIDLISSFGISTEPWSKFYSTTEEFVLGKVYSGNNLYGKVEYSYGDREYETSEPQTGSWRCMQSSAHNDDDGDSSATNGGIVKGCYYYGWFEKIG